MKFTVVWKPEAERRLTEIWLEASDRESVRVANDALETVLTQSPDLVGESRGAGRRILLIEPLGIDDRVDLDDRMVRVLTIWKTN